MCKISAIVPVYDNQEYLRDYIEGFLAQTCPKDKDDIILVDSNSTDNSAAIAKQYSDVKLLSEAKQSFSAASKCGIQAAKGSNILAFIDSSCSPSPAWLSSILKFMENPTLKIVLGKSRYATSSHKLSITEKYKFEK